MAEGKEGLLSALQAADLLEALAAVEHDRWSHWQRYMHSQCVAGEDGSLLIPPKLAEKWSRQMSTPYGELSDEEKQSDRDQVMRYLPLVAEAITRDGPSVPG